MQKKNERSGSWLNILAGFHRQMTSITERVLLNRQVSKLANIKTGVQQYTDLQSQLRSSYYPLLGSCC